MTATTRPPMAHPATEREALDRVIATYADRGYRMDDATARTVLSWDERASQARGRSYGALYVRPEPRSWEETWWGMTLMTIACLAFVVFVIFGLAIVAGATVEVPR